MLKPSSFRVAFSYQIRPGQRSRTYISIPLCTQERRIEMYDYLHKEMRKRKDFKFHAIPQYG